MYFEPWRGECTLTSLNLYFELPVMNPSDPVPARQVVALYHQCGLRGLRISVLFLTQHIDRTDRTEHTVQSCDNHVTIK